VTQTAGPCTSSKFGGQVVDWNESREIGKPTMKHQRGNPVNRCPGRLPSPLSRRDMLRSTSNGFGTLALSALMADWAGATELTNNRFHFTPRAKNVIFLFMPGGVSHVDSFDLKPELARQHGKPVGNQSNKKSQSDGNRTWKESPWRFRTYGELGMPVSELFPRIAGHVDDIAFIRSMVAELPLHAAGNLFLHSGRLRAGSPSLGSWVDYGLGNENENLPGYVLLEGGTVPPGGRENFSNGYLPASHQATSIRAKGVPVANIHPADTVAEVQRHKLRWLTEQDREFADTLGGSDLIESAIRNYELAYRMQFTVPDILDTSRETASTLRLYGVDSDDEMMSSYALQCLRARRLIESGVRFVEITANPLGISNGTWDQHSGLKKDHEINARVVDQPIAALLSDLQQRGMFEETLVLCAGEMGRTPHTGNGDGRDHHVSGFTVWMAGAGVRRGTIHGATDELGMNAVENITTVHDLHATMLHLLGLDHERLTYRYGGRDMSLTDIHGKIVDGILS